MPDNALSAFPSTGCNHSSLSFESSSNAVKTGYRRPTANQRTQAAAPRKSAKQNGTSNGIKKADDEDAIIASFPAPLVLPGDDLSVDPHYPSQNLRSWLREEDRNEVTSQRNVVYVATPPDVESDVEFMRSWSHPQRQGSSVPLAAPSIQDIIDYLAAFYYGLPVRRLPPPKLCFGTWDTGSKAKARTANPRYIGLNIATECVRIRTRASPDGAFQRQLNLDDLLDAAISMLPEDAYALLLLVEHDLFEDPDDTFVCGRAYGGSRVAVVSMARYHPDLDSQQNVEREHAWPASHCKAYSETCCAASLPGTRPRKKAKAEIKAPNEAVSQHLSAPSTTASSTDQVALPPLKAAVLVHRTMSSLESLPSTTVLSGLWLGRVCRTASHELGHCFGIDHCVYYACSMQGSASLAEDARQPPYLCPIDLAKLLYATGVRAEQRYLALLGFCNKHPQTHLFSAFAAWIRGRLTEMRLSTQSKTTD
jgi:archaemetzincin